MDPDNLPSSDPSAMNFAGGSSKPKAWKEIWGCGQGIGAVEEVVPAAALVDRLTGEYAEARNRLTIGSERETAAA
jgi:nitronate monooxygenase